MLAGGGRSSKHLREACWGGRQWSLDLSPLHPADTSASLQPDGPAVIDLEGFCLLIHYQPGKQGTGRQLAGPFCSITEP